MLILSFTLGPCSETKFCHVINSESSVVRHNEAKISLGVIIQKQFVLNVNDKGQDISFERFISLMKYIWRSTHLWRWLRIRNMCRIVNCVNKGKNKNFLFFFLHIKVAVLQGCISITRSNLKQENAPQEKSILCCIKGIIF